VPHAPGPTPRPSLKAKTVSGVKWQMVNKIAQKVISVATFAVLARILEPSTFGLFAMAFILIDGFQVLKSFGLDTALIQRKDNIEEASHTAYFIVQIQGFVLFGICFLVAPVAGYFFHNSDVTSIVRALGIIFIFTSFSKIPMTLLTKAMKFDTLALIELVGAVVNSAVAIVIALFSPTVWALVWAYVAKQFVTAVLARRLSGYRVKWQFSKKIAWELLHYGKFMVGLGILCYVSDNMGNIVVGKILGTTMLGYFALAGNIGNFINTHFTFLFSGVMLPAYASLQHDIEEVKRVYLKTTKFVSLISMPFAVGLIFLAKELVLTLYGWKWISIVPLIQLFGVFQLIVPVLACSGALFLGCGHPKYNYYLSLVSLAVKIPALIFLTHQFGLIGAVASGFVTLAIGLPLNISLVRKIITFRWREFLPQFLLSIYCSGAMIAIILGIRWLSAPWNVLDNMLPRLIYVGMISALSLGAYLGSAWLFDRAAAVEVKQLLIRKKL